MRALLGHLSPRGVTLLGLAINVVLTVGKVTAGLLFGSRAIVADGLHSASDLVTDLAVLWGLRVSSEPADGDHHYGHHRASTLSAMFVGSMLFAAALWIAYDAVTREQREVKALVPLLWAIASIALKEALFRVTRAVGTRVKDLSILANAWHHRTDAFTSVAAAIGLLGVMVLGPEWAFLDQVTALLLALYLGYASVRIVRESATELMDKAPPPKTMGDIERIVASTPGVKGYHAVRARHLGGKVSMDIHVEVDPEITVREGHDIATEVERRVRDSALGVLDVVVHVEPKEGREGE